MPKKKKNLPAKLADVKLVPWDKVTPKSIIPIGKNARAGVVVDKKGSPQLFVFDTEAMLDVLSKIDESLVDKLSDEDYHSKEVNPSGWLIDEIESRLPVNEEFASSLKAAVEEAEEDGWVTLDELEKEFGFSEK